MIVVDASGFVLAHFGAKGPSQEGLHFASSREFPPDCKRAIEALLNGSGADARRELLAMANVRGGDVEYLIRVVEVIRIERVDCNLKRTLGEELFAMSLEAQREQALLTIRMGREVPERMLVDSDKLRWAVAELVRSAVAGAPPASRKTSGRHVGVEVSFDPERNLVSVLVERNDLPGELTGVEGRFGPAGTAVKLVRAVIEAHGGVFLWNRQPLGRGMGTQISFTLPAL